jgi:hypothetical protein
MEMLMFLGLLFLFFTLGGLSIIDKNTKKFVTLAVILPFTPALIIIHTKFQISAYYGFVLIPILAYIYRCLLTSKIPESVLHPILNLSVFIALSCAYSFVFNRENFTLINVLKDIKPILILAIGYVFIDLLKNHQLEWTSKFSKRLLKVNFVITIVIFIILNNTNLLYLVGDDPFFKLGNTRYSTLGTFFAVFYFIAKLAQNERFKVSEIIYILLPVFLAGNRTFFATIGVIYGINLFLSINNLKDFIKKVGLFIVAGTVLIFGILNFNPRLKERILTMFDFELVIHQLFEYRFAPVILKLESFNFLNYIFGKGIGETFFIPWFVWRENIENNNIYMDNLYFTLYIKYGVFFFILLVFLYNFIFSANTNRRFKILITIYFVIMGLTTAFMYQNTFLFIILMLTIFKLTNHSKDKLFSTS